MLSMFHILRGLCKGLFPSFILLTKVSLMKQLVAPESTSAFMSAIALLVLIETGMCIDLNRVVTITELNLWTALTQSDGFRCSENPPYEVLYDQFLYFFSCSCHSPEPCICLLLQGLSRRL